jgi:N-alpha-acetyltransferase 15/16, NatA auxiliary subunit
MQYFEDQFDFHGFCMRKVIITVFLCNYIMNIILFVQLFVILQTTVRAYLETFKMCDSLFAHKFYQRAFRGAVRVYLSIMDTPVVDQSNLDDVDLSHLSPAEKKKEKERRRKLKKKEAEAEVAKPMEKKTPAKAGEVEAPKDDDPKGEKLMAQPPLEEASKWCLLLQLLPSFDEESRALIAEVMIRRNKFVSALRNISIGLRDQPRSPDLTVALVKFALKFELNKSPNAVANGVVQTELDKLLEGNDPITFVMRYVEESIELGLHHRNAAAKCLVELASREIGSKADMYARAIALLSDDGIWSKRGIELNSVIETYRVKMQSLFQYINKYYHIVNLKF